MTKRTFLDTPSRAVFKFTLLNVGKIIRSNFDIVIPMNGFWQLLLLKIFQPLGRYKIVVTGHSGPGWDERWNLYLKPDIFIATSEPAHEWAKQTSPWTRVELIPYAIDEKKFLGAIPATVSLKKPVILCPAALVPYKRVESAIQAVAGLKNASLLVLGKGPLAKKLQSLGSEKLKGRFLLKSVPHESIAAYYAAADVVTLPSEPQENSPMVFLESLAAGKQVVTADTARNRWMLEEAGVYCDPASEGSYKNALTEALRKGEDETSRQAIDSAFTKFRWSKVEPAYQRILESLKDGNR
jgi:glycosyltransferase involved in cell wall biosynthesis